ncbi:hypothetical protein MYXO_03215 [Myxococcaceae bacterium]|nr:hypothetical protein MYXO_03215 [Myxococcaceae bacterium]
MANEFLGKGWNFPLMLEEHAIAVASYEESIRQAIWIILGTAKGERVMRPDFGCGIYDLVFAVNNAALAGRVADEVRQSFILWEPRVQLLKVDVTSQPDEPETLLIRIEYRVRTTNNVFNLVYPFYLDRSAK